MCIRSQLCQIDGCRGNHHRLRTIPVWVKVKGKKIKVNAILDDASNESFLNEEVAGALIHVQYCQLDSIGKNRSSMRPIGKFLDDPTCRVFYLPFASH